MRRVASVLIALGLTPLPIVIDSSPAHADVCAWTSAADVVLHGSAGALALSQGCPATTSLLIDGDALDPAHWALGPTSDSLVLDTTIFEPARASHTIAAMAGPELLASATFTVDNTPPEITLVAPLAGTAVRGVIEVLVDVDAAQPAVSPVRSVQVSIDDRVVQSSAPINADAPSSHDRYSVPLDVTGLSNGPHALEILVTREDGVEASTGQTVNVANPTTALSASVEPAKTLSYGASATVTGRLIDTSTTAREPLGLREVKLFTIHKGARQPILVTTTVTDPDGLVRVKVSNARIGGQFQFVFQPEARSGQHPDGFAGSTSPWRTLVVGSSTKLNISTSSVPPGKRFSAVLSTSVVSRDGSGIARPVPVQIQVQAGTAWKTVASVTTLATTNSLTFAFPTRGTYKVRGYRGADVGLLASTSPILTLTVR